MPAARRETLGQPNRRRISDTGTGAKAGSLGLYDQPVLPRRHDRAGSMSDLIANVVGSAAAICSITSFAPQMLKIWQDRDASSVSLKTYSLTVTCFVLWVVYGIMTKAWPVTVANACALVMASGVLVMKWRFRDGDPDK